MRLGAILTDGLCDRCRSCTKSRRSTSSRKCRPISRKGYVHPLSRTSMVTPYVKFPPLIGHESDVLGLCAP